MMSDGQQRDAVLEASNQDILGSNDGQEAIGANCQPLVKPNPIKSDGCTFSDTPILVPHSLAAAQETQLQEQRQGDDSGRKSLEISKNQVSESESSNSIEETNKMTPNDESCARSSEIRIKANKSQESSKNSIRIRGPKRSRISESSGSVLSPVSEGMIIERPKFVRDNKNAHLKFHASSAFVYFRPVELCCDEGEVLLFFESIFVASEATEIPCNGIKERIERGRQPDKRFFWRFSKDRTSLVDQCAARDPASFQATDQPLAKKPCMRPGSSQEVPSRCPRVDKTRAIERLCLKSRNLLEIHPSLESAALKINMRASKFTKLLAASQPVEIGGFLWRSFPENVNLNHTPMNNARRSVEKVCLDSGKVLQSYESIASAARDLGVVRQGLWSAMKKEHNTYKGFQWRYADSFDGTKDRTATAQIQSPAIVKTMRAVEKICIHKGIVLETYPSQSAAARDIGVDRHCLWNAMQRPGRAYRGYLWRYASSISDELNRSCCISRSVEKICPKSGEILKSYESMSAAARDLGTGRHRILYAAENNRLYMGCLWRHPKAAGDDDDNKDKPLLKSSATNRPTDSARDSTKINDSSAVQHDDLDNDDDASSVEDQENGGVVYGLTMAD